VNVDGTILLCTIAFADGRYRRKSHMRKRNWRLTIVGVGLLVAAGLFFLAMMGMIPRSNDPAALMSTVGQVSGVVGGISIAMIIVGLIGKKAPTS
jgi:hypothetical protein